MDRLTGDFKGASMFATAAEARIYNKLRQYEDTGLMPEEIAALRDENYLLCAALKMAQTRAADAEAEFERLLAERGKMRERAEENPMSDATNASHEEFIDAAKALDSLGNVYMLTGVALEHDIRAILTGAHKLKKAAALLNVFAHSLRTVRAERDRLRAELDVMEAGTNADRAH